MDDATYARCRDAVRTRAGAAAVLAAPAKVNLRLKVLGRRPDGYHLLSMLNATTTLVDEVSMAWTLEGGCDVRVEPAGVVEVSSDDNLVSKSFRAFWRSFGFHEPPLGLQAHIKKRIPVGGGLGGGSSDAGAVLRALRDSFGDLLQGILGFSSVECDLRIRQAALMCGADVPYAYNGGVCWVGGIGEVVRALSVQEVWPGEVLLVIPPTGVPTAGFYDLYRKRHPTLSTVERDEPMERFSQSPDWRELPRLVENDFERDVVDVAPCVGEGLTTARRFFPQTTSLTGSGAAFFSLVAPGDETKIPECIEALRQRSMTVNVVHLLR